MILTIIIPAYNERKRLKKSLPIIIDYLKSINCTDYEIIVVDDGSTDTTREIAIEYNCILNRERGNIGKGYSVKEGVEMAQGEYILFTDADLSTPITYLGEFIKLIPQYDIVIASRAMKASIVKTPFIKELMGRLSNFAISSVVKGIYDTQCGFKLFKGDVAKKIFKKVTIEKWGFDFEVLHIAQVLEYKIKEEPVKWTNAPGSKVKISDYPETLMDLMKIKRNKYD